jgi:hypothetical protein
MQPPQALPQLPQLFASLRRSTQMVDPPFVPGQAEVPATQLAWQLPPPHTCAALQAGPQVPPLQISPGPQTWPQVPQLLESEVTSTHVGKGAMPSLQLGQVGQLTPPSERGY